MKRMSANLWPGLTSEGLPMLIPDLTAPPVYLQTLSTPYGTMGAVLPLVLVLLYSSSIEMSAGGEEQIFASSICLFALHCTCSQCWPISSDIVN